jgi:hypothetical protein
MNKSLIHQEEWDRFAAALALGDLDKDDVLILSLTGPVTYYVQYSPYEGALRAEAVGNLYILPAEARLSGKDYATMDALGWQPPTNLPPEEAEPSDPAGSPNFFLNLPLPVDTQALAALSVRTFREVYRVARPGELEYFSFETKDGVGIRFPSLDIKRRRPPEWEKAAAGNESADRPDPLAEANETIRQLRTEKAQFVAILDWLLKQAGDRMTIALADLLGLSPNDQVLFWLDHEHDVFVLTRVAPDEHVGCRRRT